MLFQMSRWTAAQWIIFLTCLVAYGIMSIAHGDFATFLDYWNGM